MSAYKFVNPAIGVPSPSDTGTFGTGAGQAPPLPFGFIAEAVDPTMGYAEFVFVKGASASTVGKGDAALVVNGAAQQLVSGNTASQGAVGIGAGPISATNVWGWLQIYGGCDYAKMYTAGVANGATPLYIGTTAGRLQTTAGATGYIINGAKLGAYVSTSQSDAATVQLYYPVYDGRNQ